MRSESQKYTFKTGLLMGVSHAFVVLGVITYYIASGNGCLLVALGVAGLAWCLSRL